MEIHLATWIKDRYQGQALTKVGAFRRLTSYFFINDGTPLPHENFVEYIKKGKDKDLEYNIDRSNKERVIRSRIRMRK